MSKRERERGEKSEGEGRKADEDKIAAARPQQGWEAARICSSADSTPVQQLPRPPPGPKPLWACSTEALSVAVPLLSMDPQPHKAIFFFCLANDETPSSHSYLRCKGIIPPSLLRTLCQSFSCGKTESLLELVCRLTCTLERSAPPFPMVRALVRTLLYATCSRSRGLPNLGTSLPNLPR